MIVENRICKNCRQSFTIEEEDFDFFKQMKVAPPRFCAQCGVQWAMALRNEGTFYKGVCAKCRKPILSMYYPNAPYVVYCHDCWWADDWDGTDFGMEYDPKRPLMEQFGELQKKVPREALIIINSTNCNFGNHVRGSKDVYFSYLIAGCENILYSTWINNVKDCINSSKAVESELVAESIDVSKCYHCIFLQDSADCSECYFSYDLKGCTDCMFSWNLRNKSHYVYNKQVSKEEYERFKTDTLDGSFLNLEKKRKKYEELKTKALRKFAFVLKSNNVEGNYLEGCSESMWCFDGFNDKNVKSVASVLNSQRGMYSYSIGVEPVEFFYGSSVIKGGTNIRFSFNLAGSSDCTYCDSLISSSHCVASVSLKRKEYCILNRQYPKEEYEKIIQGIATKGELNDFPSPAFSTFAYNETVAISHYPMKKEEAMALGYFWRDDAQFTTGQETLKPNDIPDRISDVRDDVIKEVLRCIECGRNYRVVVAELNLHRKFNLPLSRTCPQCHFEYRRVRRLPYKLWHRTCSCGGGKSQAPNAEFQYENTVRHFHGDKSCPNEFKTSYAPERPEIVYCEQCYQSEII